jgi:hypothetical protein
VRFVAGTSWGGVDGGCASTSSTALMSSTEQRRRLHQQTSSRATRRQLSRPRVVAPMCRMFAFLSASYGMLGFPTCPGFPSVVLEPSPGRRPAELRREDHAAPGHLFRSASQDSRSGRVGLVESRSWSCWSCGSPRETANSGTSLVPFRSWKHRCRGCAAR